ncbi:class I SAM-dependent methyltransferase [Cellulosimicrobium cellulans]|uniref:class I SAM-dependent methyltransferase n=1 Tax=Cellulosimicrobium cellulans TaxID=1710 RepID=UPI0009F2060F|nr:class I SAM-dependent methyltransferase [Cellulosimicrobium cellulans]
MGDALEPGAQDRRDVGGSPDVDATSTTAPEYTRRLRELQGAWWKRALHVQAPYRWNVRRHLGARRTLDLGCGIGRNLLHLPPGSAGVDHNASSVAFCRSLGMEAYTPTDFFDALSRGQVARYEALLVAHVLEHLEPGSQERFLRPYLDALLPGAHVLVICPQERGFASDPSHTELVDADRIVQVLRTVGVQAERARSFPLPRWAGRLFVYNEFVVHGRLVAHRHS